MQSPLLEVLGQGAGQHSSLRSKRRLLLKDRSSSKVFDSFLYADLLATRLQTGVSAQSSLSNGLIQGIDEYSSVLSKHCSLVQDRISARLHRGNRGAAMPR